MAFWLMKSEPNVFSINDLRLAKDSTECWDGVRNYQARNFMKEMRKGDLAFFYHSNTKIPGIVGIMEVCREAYPDHTALDPASKYFDEKSSAELPRWCMVDVKFKEIFSKIISLQQLKDNKALTDFILTRRGNRLSILPVSSQEWGQILAMLES